MMKRFFGFLFLAALLATSCDDGDLTEVSFEFDETSAKSCNATTNKFFIYKTTDQRAIILQVAENNFTNTVTTDTLAGVPITLDINATSTTNQLIYRVYSDNITENTICSAFPASYPVVTEERAAIGGKATINTTAIKSEPDANGATKINSYQHAITFSDVTFNIGDGSQRNESLPSIIYSRPAPVFSAFDGLTGIKKCGDNLTYLYKSNATQALSLKLSAEAAAYLFSTTTTETKKQVLDANNILLHRFFFKTETNPLTDAYFCASTTPVFPAVKETWKGANSTADTNGIIEVVTAQSQNGYKHTITLRNVKMEKGSQNFLLKTEFVFGEFETPAP